ncbi:MAG: hypothetical protein ACUZ8N_10630, partial [Candidatus Scalindua sp.]
TLLNFTEKFLKIRIDHSYSFHIISDYKNRHFFVFRDYDCSLCTFEMINLMVSLGMTINTSEFFKYITEFFIMERFQLSGY